MRHIYFIYILLLIGVRENICRKNDNIRASVASKFSGKGHLFGGLFDFNSKKIPIKSHQVLQSMFLPPMASCGNYKLPANVQFSCRGNFCEVYCPNFYKFPDGSKSLKMKCVAHRWIILESEYTMVPTCKPICEPPCQNNGICIEAGVCQCPENISGSFCQYKKSICVNNPPIPKNSKISCVKNICSAECMKGYKFADGSTIGNIECQDNEWIFKKTGSTIAPDCIPTCYPACENDGKCISFNVCQCPKMFRGNHCQFPISNCNVTKTNFNGNYKCTYNTDLTICKLTCPDLPIVQVDGTLANQYECDYITGKFSPQPIPKCIYPPDHSLYKNVGPMRIIEKSEQLTIEKHHISDEWIPNFIANYKSVKLLNEWWFLEESVTTTLYKLYTHSSEKTKTSMIQKKALCVTWGGNFFKTFDGVVFKTPISCSYILATIKDTEEFKVVLKKCPSHINGQCAHSLKILWQSVMYTFENINGTLKLKTTTKELPIPLQTIGMKVYSQAQYLHIEFESIGFHIIWDHDKYIEVHVSNIAWNNTGGLCGLFDSNDENDLTSKHGTIVETINTFMDSWRYDSRSEKCAMNTSVSQQLKSSCEVNKSQAAIDTCTRLFNNPKLFKCIGKLNLEALINSCINEYCHCSDIDHPEKCICDMLMMLVRECSFNGIAVEHGWRDFQICPVNCSNGRIYRSCGPEIESSCSMSESLSEGKCKEGCFCPEGTVQYKNECILPELCPCTMRNKEFKSGATVKKDCNVCICSNGHWKCTAEKCGARCGAIGDPHYQTFDGKRFDFMGKCSYYLLKSSNISVEAENVACSGIISENMKFESTLEVPSCTKSATVHVLLKNGERISIKLTQDFLTFINNKPINKLPKVLGLGEVLIRRPSSSFITVELSDGVRVWWDGVTRLYIDVPPSYRGKTAGLCGTFNSNTKDDFTTPEGDIETAIIPFANKWTTKDSCTISDDSMSGFHTCLANPEKRIVAEKLCSWILNDIFQGCHWNIEPEPYYDDCIYDVCACEDDPAKCFCPIIAAYGMECMRQGIQTSWRLYVDECAIKCDLGQIYEECGDSCSRTCDDLASKNFCKKECVEGCRCPRGEFLNENNECVPQSKCHCSYDGVYFKPGYKEVRPGKKILDLCTCVNGVWDCEAAEADDEIKHPPSSDIRSECLKVPFASFAKCAPKEKKTCTNMNEYTEDLEECKPGCVCDEGFVFDNSKNACISPEKCSCHHAGKSYNDGDLMTQDCNTCKCHSGSWKCSNNSCDSTCSVWGDSHFTTFDNNEFDFQGACDYILSKGKLESGDGFTITIQNVLCGSLGVTCSKSVEIALTGTFNETLLLSKQSMYTDDPNQTTINSIRQKVNKNGIHAFNIYKAGIYIVVEVPLINLQVKWDEGTAVYVKLGSQWKQKTNGLCGNYNDNAMDDMQTPSNGFEISPLIFGHAWKVQEHCSKPTQLINSCKEHPDRETWAKFKCGILKSNVFKECHSEVPLDSYLKRCIFDSCACDQGGDCECLCTAVAAYSHTCSQKGVNIRWRTPHFCPMQCDAHCSDYQACTPACPVETCDNFLDAETTDRMCNSEHCIEGCLLKSCDEGMIYSNDSYKECIPKSVCKPVCLVKNGITYYEGDIMFKDECSTCHCSKKKEICTGVKCSEKSTTTFDIDVYNETTEYPLGTAKQVKCTNGWTRWYDEDTDASNDKLRQNDVEKLPRYDPFESIYASCTKEFIENVECRVVSSHEVPQDLDENVVCNKESGLVCRGNCHDYEIRALCQCDKREEDKITDIRKISMFCNITHSEYKEVPTDCHKFLHCALSQSGEWQYVEKTCGEFMMFNPINNICDHVAIVKHIRPECSPKDSKEKCADNFVWSECANKCEKTCHYYTAVLESRGLCKANETCKPGCMQKDHADCFKDGMFWRDEKTCVEMDQCPCMDENEKYVQPLIPVIHEWKTCQCIHNIYTCVPNEIVTVKPDLITQAPMKITSPIPESHIVPVTACSPEKLKWLVQGVVPLPDDALTASSHLTEETSPSKARFSAQNDSGSWAPKINDEKQYLQINFPKQEKVFGIKTAGNPIEEAHVTHFKVMYSLNNREYNYVLDENANPTLFNGGINSLEHHQNLFNTPFEAISIRIYPVDWHNSIALRADVLGCEDMKTTESQPFFAATTLATILDEVTTSYIEKTCLESLGNESHPLQVKASSLWPLPKTAKTLALSDLLHLSSPIGWRPVINSPKEYIEFNFSVPRNISGLNTKGGPDGWVTKYMVYFSKNKFIWNEILSDEGKPKIFEANHDADIVTLNTFPNLIRTQYLKVVPTEWHDNINMRVEPVGCYEQYSEIKSVSGDGECNNCEAVTVSLLEKEKCHCEGNLFWNGNTCVPKNLCPCLDNYIVYGVGATFVNNKCEQCSCIVGGQIICKPKKCPLCENNLSPNVTTNCDCTCVPCPENQRICPSSGDCIPEVLWCNGVQNCADDEDDSCQHRIDLSSEQLREKNETSRIICPEPSCPPQMKIIMLAKSSRKMSKMFSMTIHKQFTIDSEGTKVTKTVTKTSELKKGGGDKCPEFSCIPTTVQSKNKSEYISCTDPKCPDNYDVEMDLSNAKSGFCPKYSCILRPQKDDVCDIYGKTLTTFDGTEIKYDVCSHILARDISNSKWMVSLHLKCLDASRKVCHKTVTIYDKETGTDLTIMHSLKVMFNGFEYSVKQLENSQLFKQSFVLSQPGNTVLVVSPKYGFWVSVDHIGIIKVGVSRKFLNTVDGLCGFYNGNPHDDKKSPDNKTLTNVKEFAESWFDKKLSKEECSGKQCSLALQRNALVICNSIKHPSFASCSKSINYKQYVSKCIDTTCECLQANNNDIGKCKCNILQNFVKNCLSTNPFLDLSSWRSVHQCEISCPSPLIHSDCYKKRCEPSCTTLRKDDCPIIPGSCFAGCHCPEGTVRKDETCVPLSDCKDCVCKLLGPSSLTTFDQKNFQFEGNCTYLLSRDIVLPGVHSFQIFVSIEECLHSKSESDQMKGKCVKALHIISKDHVIHISKQTFETQSTKITIDGLELKKNNLKDAWIALHETVLGEIVLKLLNPNIELFIYFKNNIFSIEVPGIKYGGKMEGLCGDCNLDPANDLRLNPSKRKPTGKIDTLDIINSWQITEPKLGLSEEDCQTDIKEEKQCEALATRHNPCLVLSTVEIFGKCNVIVDPKNYILSCQQEMCLQKNESRVCNVFAAYAKECLKHGICVNWRGSDICPYNCPMGTVYNPCACSQTCETYKASLELNDPSVPAKSILHFIDEKRNCLVKEQHEGCFCPSGEVMNNGTCVPVKDCTKCEDSNHLPGEKWLKDVCTECLCNHNGKTECATIKCSVNEIICSIGYKPKQVKNSAECCPNFICIPEPKRNCTSPEIPHCGANQIKKQSIDKNGCSLFVCECVPKSECPPLPDLVAYPGEIITVLEGCCPSLKIECDKTNCPQPPSSCENQLQTVQTIHDKEACCPKYKCAFPKNKCLFNDEDSKQVLRNINDTWADSRNPCKNYICAFGANDTTIIMENVLKCNSTCPLGFTYIKTDVSKCCGKCVQNACVFDSVAYEPGTTWESKDSCTKYSCIKDASLAFVVVSTKETCPDISDCPETLTYTKGCCKLCKFESKEQNTCNIKSLPLNETIKILEVHTIDHGKCVNLEPVEGFTECSGLCYSSTKYFKDIQSYSKICRCCSVQSFKKLKISLTCEDDLMVDKEVEVPQKCNCSSCSDSMDYKI